MNTLPPKPPPAGPKKPGENRRARRRSLKKDTSSTPQELSRASSASKEIPPSDHVPPTPDAASSSAKGKRVQLDTGSSPRVIANGRTGAHDFPPASTSTSASAVTTAAAASATFEEGVDFIPFPEMNFSDEEEDRSKIAGDGGKGSGEPSIGGGGRLDKGKGKSRRDDVLPAEPAKERSRRRDRTPPAREREWDRGKKPRERSREREQERERDDGRGGSKRKYELVFDPSDGYANKKQRVDASSRKAPWVDGLDWDACLNVAEMLHREVEAFVNWISPTPEEDEIRGLIVSLISKAVTSAFPDAQVLPFGSYQTKLYLPLGDIDLVILSNSMAYSDKVTVLHALANTLKRAGITPKVTIIAKAKVPIVKFITTHGRFNVDISINQENGVVSGEMVNGFLRDMHGSGPEGRGSMALRSLVLITKAFLSQRSMNEVFTGGLGSYSIVCLAVSFLQMHPKIRNGEINPEKNLGVLVMEFFELYGCYFNYDEVGISVRGGGTYFNKRQRGWHDYYKSNLLSIEDPAEPSNDISRGSYGFQKVRATFAGAYGILTSTAYLRAGMISSRRAGRSVRLRKQNEPEDLSILSSVMGVTQETINHRKMILEIYNKRTLHNLVGVKPKPTQVYASGSEGQEPSSPSTSRGAKSVQSAWQEADVAHSDDNREQRNGRHHAVEDDEGGRYDITRQEPPKKRRKMGRREDKHTVFIADDEDEGEVTPTLVEGVDTEEEGEYASDGATEARVRRRSYWLSKGIGRMDSDSG